MKRKKKKMESTKNCTEDYRRKENRHLKSLTRTDKGKGVAIHSDVKISFKDDDSYDSSLNGDMTYDGEMQLIRDVSAMSEDEEGNGSDYSLVDEDEIFNHLREYEIDYYEKVYDGGKLLKLEVTGYIVLRQWDMFEDKKHFLDVFKDYLMQEVVIRRARRMILNMIEGKHEKGNFRTAYPRPKLKALMLKVANSYSDWSHNKPIHALKIENLGAYYWLLDEPKKRWYRHLFQISTKLDDNAANFMETLNNILNMARDKPIYNLLEEIRDKLTE
ncbi:hypothetical protein Cgig2_010933 [Carnegiea gigantea]|uniref:Uncharacterized protein n=1 Tax=Carnegiea gigantea TaxID=171969 RepID=A0A9Q1GWI0_9CARY|nr:hypothetical protein Cgig2_010933 [Carnegiea gigantea]